MAWGGLIAVALVLWAGCGAVIAMGREVWPEEMAEAVHLAVAPAIAAAVTVAHKIMAPDFSALVRAAAFVLIVGALDVFVLAPLVHRGHAMVRSALGAWLPLAAIFVASWIVGAFAPV